MQRIILPTLWRLVTPKMFATIVSEFAWYVAKNTPFEFDDKIAEVVDESLGIKRK
jgi:hypothetical protein